MHLRTIQNIFMTFWLAGERSLPFGLLVSLPFASFLTNTLRFTKEDIQTK